MKMKNKSKIILSTVALSVMLWGCKAPELTSMEKITLPDTYTGNFTDTSNVAQLSWKTFFPDTLLQGYIEMALKKNYSFQQTLERISLAKTQVWLGKGALLPDISIGVNGGIEKFGDYTMDGVGNSTTNTPDLSKDKHIPDPYRDLNIGIGFQWEADIWGKLNKKKQAAAARWMSSVEAARLSQTILISEIASLYFELVGLDKQREILKDAIAKTKASYKLTYELKQEGEVSQLAVDQFQTHLLKLEGSLLENEQQIGEKERGIATLTGSFPFKVKRITFAEMERLDFPVNAGLPSQLLQLRPDIRSAEFELLASKADVSAARKAFFPSLVIGGSGGFSAFDISKWFTSPGSLIYSLGVGITAPIFKQYEIRALWDNSKSNQRIALAHYHDTALKAYEEVINLMAASEQLDKRMKLKKKESIIHHRSISNANDMFKLNFVGYLEVLSADERFLDCELEYASLSVRNCITKVLLYRALGGGN